MKTHSVHQLRLEPLGEGSWRLCDHSLSPNDPGCLIAYVEQLREGPYEITWVAFSRHRETYDSVNDVLRAANALLNASGSSGPNKPAPIPHLPPLVAR
ncbi:hypothetical protein [Microbacterium marmarense]|uniref:Uncharacterized protein n=1 Tax=Microbacterium marmarense TaxID=3122051 RepID=A0ABU8LSD6_9MICO